MAHKTLINGTAYKIKGGKTLVNGTGYGIKGGKTLVGGTAYEIGFGKLLFDFGTITTTKSFFGSYYLCSHPNRIVMDFDPLESNILNVNGVEYSVEAFKNLSGASEVGYGIYIIGGTRPSVMNPNIAENYPYSIWISATTDDGTRSITFYSYTEGTYTVSLWKK